MPELPSGTVTFLFTDIEASTALLKRIGGAYSDVLAEHERILREAFAAHGGHVVDTQGDSFFVAFRRAKDAVAAAADAQRDLDAHSWPEGVDVLVRMGLHTGEPKVGDQRYVGIGVNKAARIGAAGHGGQVLLSATTRELVEDELPPGVTIRDLGERRLKDLDRPERLFQLVIEGLRSDFAQLKTLDVGLRRRRRRMYGGAALIGVLAAAVAIPVFALGQGGGGGSPLVPPNSLAVIDPGSNRVTASVQNVVVRPSAIAYGEGSLWVGSLESQTVTRIDATTRALEATIQAGGTATGIAAGGGAVWVANGLAGVVSRIDPAINAISATISDAGRRSNGGAIALDPGGRTVWFVSGAGTVARIDAARNNVTGSGIAGVSPSAITVTADGSVWVANAGGNSVVRFNPRTVGVVKTVTVGRTPRALAAGADSVWVASQGDDSVYRIDTGSGSVVTIPVGHEPTGIAVSATAVWVANAGDGTVSRIDSATNRVTATIEVGNRPSGVAVGGGAVWVTVQAPPT